MSLDLGEVGFHTMSKGQGLPHTSDFTFRKHQTHVYDHMDEFFIDNLPLAHDIINQFYNKFHPNRVSRCGRYKDLFVSIDGSYDKRGFHGTHCCMFVYDVYTGIAVDFQNLEKCFGLGRNSACSKIQTYKKPGGGEEERPLCDTPGTICPDGKHHGSSGSMEAECAKILFERSTNYKYRYTTYVSDGDNKTYEKIKNSYGLVAWKNYNNS